MIILLYGPDSYNRQRKLREIIGEYQKKHSSLTVRVVERADENISAQLNGMIGRQTLFGGKTLVIIKDFFPVSEKEAKEIKKALESALNSENETFILTASEAPAKAFSFLLQKPAMFQEFPELFGAKMETFIKQEATRAGARLSPAILRDLSFAFSGDSWGVVSELEKLALKNKAEFRPDGGHAEQNVFSTLLQLRSSRRDAALPLLERLMNSEDPARLFNLLAYQSAGAEKCHLADYDVAVKSGKLDYETALTDFTMK